MDVLKKLGLRKYEATVYSSLTIIGRSSATNLSEHSKVPITAVYPTLKSLIKKQLVQQIKGDPALFEIVNPDIAINHLIKTKERELSAIREETIRYVKSLKNKENDKSDKDRKQVLTITHGKELSKEVYLESFSKAKSTFYILGWRLEKVGDKYNLLRKFRELIKRKVDVRIILIGTVNKKWDVINAYLEEGIKIKFLPIDNFSIFILDGKECKITLKDKTLIDKFNIQIQDESFAKAMNFYFLDCWDKAREITE